MKAAIFPSGRATAPLPLLFLAQARGMGAERARGLAAAS